MAKNLNFYANKFQKLRVDRARGDIAPHKPILLLVVLGMVQQGSIRRNEIYLSPELISTFLKYWGYLGSEQRRSDIALPFYHLIGDGFWHLMPNPGFEATIAAKVRLRSLSALRDAVKYAYVDEALFECWQDATSRDALIYALMQAWFQGKETEVQSLFQVNAFQEFQLRLFEKGGAVYQVEDLKDEELGVVRDAAFRRNVISLYQQRCSFCGLKVISIDGQNIVDGAHIKPFAEFRDDRFDNGLSLCKNHHWAFDRGWFSIDDDYRIIIPRDRFTEESPIDTRSMQDFHGEQIILPVKAEYYPRLEALNWHRDRWNIT